MTGNACGRTGFRSCGGRTEGSAGHLPLEKSRYEDRDRFGPLRVLLTGLSAFLEPSPDTLTDLPRNLIGFIDNFAGTLRQPSSVVLASPVADCSGSLPSPSTFLP